MMRPSPLPERLAALCSRMGSGTVFVLVLAVLAALTACRPAMPEPAAPAAEIRVEPAGVYVILPGSYSRYLAEGLVFASGGAPEDLPVYASAGEAQQALRDLEARAVHSRHVWRVFRLEADWNKDVAALGDGYRLSGPAGIAEMLADEDGADVRRALP